MPIGHVEARFPACRNPIIMPLTPIAYTCPGKTYLRYDPLPGYTALFLSVGYMLTQRHDENTPYSDSRPRVRAHFPAPFRFLPFRRCDSCRAECLRYDSHNETLLKKKVYDS